MVGLVEAAHKYSPTEAQFSTYAYNMIKWAILSYLQANNSPIKIPWAYKDKTQFSFMSLSESDNENSASSPQIDIYDEDDGYSFVELLESIKKVLTEREYSVLMMKYKGYSQLEISKNLGISQSRVSKILSSIKETVKPILRGGD